MKNTPALEQCRSALEACAQLTEDLLETYCSGLAAALGWILSEDISATLEALDSGRELPARLANLAASTDRLQQDADRAGIATEAPGIVALTREAARLAAKAAAA
jgi:hypothetical protein